jgi:opacity protein-like surface antigen
MHLHKNRRSLQSILMLILTACLWTSPSWAQVAPSAFRAADSLWVGGEYANFDASFPYQSHQRLQGIGAFVDFNLNAHLGVEGDARFLSFGGFDGVTESTYLIGPRYRFAKRARLQPYAQALFGVGHIHYPFEIGDANYFALAPAGGISYRLRGQWSLRAEYEYQFWLNSPGYSNQPSHQLRPNGFNLGVAYRLFR